MVTIHMKYESETGRKLSGYAFWVLVLALVTAVLFVVFTFNMLLG